MTKKFVNGKKLQLSVRMHGEITDIKRPTEGSPERGRSDGRALYRSRVLGENCMLGPQVTSYLHDTAVMRPRLLQLK